MSRERTKALAVVKPNDAPEIYVDLADVVVFDGTILRIELCVDRYDTLPKDGPPTGKRVTAVRLVMPLPAAHRLAQRIDEIHRQAATPRVRRVPKNVN